MTKVQGVEIQRLALFCIFLSFRVFNTHLVGIELSPCKYSTFTHQMFNFQRLSIELSSTNRYTKIYFLYLIRKVIHNNHRKPFICQLSIPKKQQHFCKDSFLKSGVF